MNASTTSQKVSQNIVTPSVLMQLNNTTELTNIERTILLTNQRNQSSAGAPHDNLPPSLVSKCSMW